MALKHGITKSLGQQIVVGRGGLPCCRFSGSDPINPAFPIPDGYFYTAGKNQTTMLTSLFGMTMTFFTAFPPMNALTFSLTRAAD